jgi:branched-chain amino acid transport system ATP-binding protein
VLQISQLNVHYGDAHVVRGIDLQVDTGEIVCLVGANGAGKTTCLRAVSGVLKPSRGEIAFAGKRIDRCDPSEIVARGLVQVSEGRALFPNMTVTENLEMGSISSRAKPERAASMRHVFEVFPRLEERKGQHAGTLSGGEQQMLAIGRALMGRPKLLVLDEPSIGLAPLLVKQIFAVIQEIRQTGTTVLLVEQNLHQALSIADRAYVIASGEVVLSGGGTELLANEKTRSAYLGLVN